MCTQRSIGEGDSLPERRTNKWQIDLTDTESRFGDFEEQMGGIKTSNPEVSEQMSDLAVEKTTGTNDETKTIAEAVESDASATRKATIELRNLFESLMSMHSTETKRLETQIESLRNDLKAFTTHFASELKRVEAGQQATVDPSTPVNPALLSHSNPVDNVRGMRFHDGRINFEHRMDATDYGSLGPRELGIKTIFPAMVLPQNAPQENPLTHQSSNEVGFPAGLKLATADHETLDKLQQIQFLLKSNLIPYGMWAERVAFGLSDDFKDMRLLIESQQHVDWLTFVECIIQVLHDHNVLNQGLATFLRLLPLQGEDYHGFSCRLRQAFHRLSDAQRRDFGTRVALIDKLETYQPTLWAEMRRHIDTLSTADIMEEICIRAKGHNMKAVEEEIYSRPNVAIPLLQGHASTTPDATIQSS